MLEKGAIWLPFFMFCNQYFFGDKSVFEARNKDL